MMLLPDAEWRHRPGLRRLVEALTADGGVAHIVGGAVRDTLLALPVSDVDLATPLLPEAVIERAAAKGMKAVPTGISHGTITVVSDGHPYEVTTLRRDVATDGRHASIVYSSDWQEDAARRDFTINALYADPMTGEIYDWFGGREDLAAGRIRFIGDPVQRIAEDHLRILRFYRFAARFGRGALDPASHHAVVAARHSLRTLSRERVADELFKILALPSPLAVLQQMVSDAIFPEIAPECDAGAAIERLGQLLANELAIGIAADPVRRAAALLPTPGAAEAFGARLRLSNRVRARLVLLAQWRDRIIDQSAQVLAYHIGTDAARDCWLLAGTGEGVVRLTAALSEWTPPIFPVRGGMLVALGVAAGPDVARLLKQAEADWIAAGFPSNFDHAGWLAKQGEAEWK